MSDIAISVQKLSKRYEIYDSPRDRLKQFIFPRFNSLIGLPVRQYCREFWALKDVSFDVKKGETVGIVGRNGSGKSTLLQMICGTLHPTSGEIQTSGRIAALLELGSGFNSEFTGRENVYLNAAVLGLSNEEIDARFDDIAAFADIGDFLEQPIKTYSSGMVMRLAFAVQAAIDPDIFVVDEALAVGDEKFQRKCFSRLDELKSKGSSILFVSHSPASIVELCDRTLVLDHGLRLMYGDAAKAIRAYQKLIYAPPHDEIRLVEEYRNSDLMGNMDEIAGQEGTINEVREEPLASFDQGLTPETTLIYPKQGAEILEFQILDIDNRRVNVLQARENYQFVISGKFLKNFKGIFFGVHIRNISGSEITGQRFPEVGKYFEDAKVGESFTISFGFKMDVLPGVYFSGGGIWSSEEPECAHRILDAVMFRVMPTKKQESFGFVDSSTRTPTLNIT